MPAPTSVCTPPLLGSQQSQIPHALSHENVPQYQIQPQISQADHIPPPAQKDGPAPEVEPLPPVQNSELVTQIPAGQHASRMSM